MFFFNLSLIDCMVYWKKTESMWVEKLILENFANALNCDCDIQLGQCPTQMQEKNSDT